MGEVEEGNRKKGRKIERVKGEFEIKELK